MTTVLAGTVAGLLRAAALARQGVAVRVLRAGRLRGLGVAPVRRRRELEALRVDFGVLGWVPRHARRELDGVRVGALSSELRQRLEARVGAWMLDGVDYAFPARGWSQVEARAEAAVLGAGGDVVDVEPVALEIEDGRIAGIETDVGFEWVDDLHTDLSVGALHALAEGAALMKAAEVDLVGQSGLPWETLIAEGPVLRLVRHPIDPLRHSVHLGSSARPRRDALAAVGERMVVDGVGETRTGPAHLEGRGSHLGATLIPPLR